MSLFNNWVKGNFVRESDAGNVKLSNSLPSLEEMPLKKGRLKTRGQIIPERPRKGLLHIFLNSKLILALCI